MPPSRRVAHANASRDPVAGAGTGKEDGAGTGAGAGGDVRMRGGKLTDNSEAYPGAWACQPTGADAGTGAS